MTLHMSLRLILWPTNNSVSLFNDNTSAYVITSDPVSRQQQCQPVHWQYIGLCHHIVCGLRGAVVSVVAFWVKGRGFKSTHGCSHTVQKPLISPRLFGQCTWNISLPFTLYHLPQYPPRNNEVTSHLTWIQPLEVWAVNYAWQWKSPQTMDSQQMLFQQKPFMWKHKDPVDKTSCHHAF